MTTQHPDYDITKVQLDKPRSFKCSCGDSFTTLRGLRTHQGWRRKDDWYAPGKSKTAYYGGAHLTVV
jgi:hypothetical protein